jgi:Ala-tRNA(Pro) deacylase
VNECLRRLETELGKASLNYEVFQHPVGYTAQHEAAAAHVPGHSFAKSVVVLADGKPAQLVLSAPHQVDFGAVREYLGAAELRLANEQELVGLFPDSEPGAMPPIPGGEGMPIYLDRALAASETIVFAAGSHTDSMRMATRDYLQFVDPPILEFAAEPIQSASAASDQLMPSLPREGPYSPGWAVRSALMLTLSTLLILGLRRLGRLVISKPLAAFIAGNAVGAAALALTDSRSGSRRRAIIRDKTRKFARMGVRRLRGQAIRAGGAAKGAFHEWRRTRVGA